MAKQKSGLNYLLLIIASFMLGAFPAQSEEINTSQSYPETIGKYASYYQENMHPLNFEQSLKMFKDGQFEKSDNAVLNFGISAKPVWIAFNISNPATSGVKRRLTFETSWLDKVEIYIVQNGQIMQQYLVGDTYPFEDRPIKDRFFSIEHNFTVGHTAILARIESIDPLVLPINFSSIQQAQVRNQNQGYLYGIIYGAISALLAYNFILYFSLGLQRYLFYSIYLAFFLIGNLAYTGHGYQWLWPQTPLWQQWSPPVLMHAFGISGLLFATHFLNTKISFPRLHKFVIAFSSLFSLLLLFALVTNDKSFALFSAFVFITSFAFILIVMGLMSLYSGNRAAHFFLLASVTAGISASITATSVWGIIEYSDIRYHAAEFGMVFDAVFLALALAHSFRVSEAKKIEAEKMARIDPLTSLNNRRAFYEFSSVIWNSTIRKNSALSIIMIDIDKFKKINDTYGHKYGDQALIQISQLLKSENRVGDLIARWGGEEFIILLPDTIEQDAIIISERFRKEIAELAINVGSKNINVTSSFGVASKTTTYDSLDELISLSDKYLYHAKQSGRNKVCSSQNINS